jgi:hypothetical protein
MLYRIFTSDNEPYGIESATHNTFICKVNLDIVRVHIQIKFANVLWVAFSVPSAALSLVKYPA